VNTLSTRTTVLSKVWLRMYGSFSFSGIVTNSSHKYLVTAKNLLWLQVMIRSSTYLDMSPLEITIFAHKILLLVSKTPMR